MFRSIGAGAAVGALDDAPESVLARQEFPRAPRLILIAAMLVGAAWVAPRLRAEDNLVDASSADSTPVSATELNNQGVALAKAGNFEEGIALVRRAVQQAPGDAQLRKNLSGMLADWAAGAQEEGQEGLADALLSEAIEHDGTNAKALMMLGNAAYLRQDGLEAAIGFWKRAFALLPSAQRQGVSDRIAQAERDRAVERAFGSRQSAHFVIRFEGQEFADEAEALGAVLEQEYGRLEGALGQGPGRLTVLLYTGGSFQRVSGRKDWALGLYDGRIRLRVEELRAEFAPDVIAHELTHAWLSEGFGSRIPTWIHEGLAQHQEPHQDLHAQQQAIMDAIASRASWVPLKWIDRRFEQPSNRDDLERAYLQARWAVAALVERHGMARMRVFLQQLSSGKPMERAFDEAFAPARWARFDQGRVD